MKIYQLDRYEGGYAVLVDIEDFSIVNVPKESLPANAKELSIFRLEDEIYILDIEETEKRIRETRDLFFKLQGN